MASLSQAPEQEQTRGPAPVAAPERLDALDVMRGIAVCGILAVNIFVMGTVGSTQGRTFPATLNADWVAWVGQRLLLEGPMRGLFMILFGAGMVIMLRKSEQPDGNALPIDVWTRRCLALLLLGVVQFLILMWPGEILWTLGVAGLALVAFRTAKVRTLWIWALFIIACLSAHRAYDTSTYVSTYQAAAEAERAKAAGVELSPEQQKALDAVASAKAANYPTADALAQQIKQRTELRSLIGWSATGWAFRHLEIYSWIAVAESLAFMLVGMALFRSGILTGERSPRNYWIMLIVLGGVGLAIRGLDFAWQARTAFELDIHRLNPVVSVVRSGLYQPARLALTLAYVALILLAVRSSLGAWKVPFRALGRMALTNYTLHSLLTSLLFYWLGYLGAFGAATLLLLTVVICLATAGISMLWLRQFQMGPMEWLLRALAYGTFSPARRSEATALLKRSPAL